MELIQSLFPAGTGVGAWSVLALCVLVFLGVALSLLLPWMKSRRERERVNRGDYY